MLQSQQLQLVGHQKLQNYINMQQNDLIEQQNISNIHQQQLGPQSDVSGLSFPHIQSQSAMLQKQLGLQPNQRNALQQFLQANGGSLQQQNVTAQQKQFIQSQRPFPEDSSSNSWQDLCIVFIVLLLCFVIFFWCHI